MLRHAPMPMIIAVIAAITVMNLTSATVIFPVAMDVG
jgi:hypothetical protein